MQAAYKLIVNLSHYRVAFDLYSSAGEGEIIPVSYRDCNWPEPLAFYIHNNGNIAVGEEAERARRAGTPNSFANYFDIADSSLTYSIKGVEKPIREILPDAVEQVIAHCVEIGMIPFVDKGGLPVVLICEVDIDAHEREKLEILFRQNGFAQTQAVFYEHYLSDYFEKKLLPQYEKEKVVAVWSGGRDLALNCFDGKTGKDIGRIYYGLGVDPRVNSVMKIIWDRIQDQNPYLPEKDNRDIIEREALAFLQGDDKIARRSVILTDGYKYHYWVDYDEVVTVENSETQQLKRKFNAFLQECEIINKRNVILFLRGITAHNPYFETNLNTGFPTVVRTTGKIRETIIKGILNGTTVPKMPAPEIEEIPVATPPPIVTPTPVVTPPPVKSPEPLTPEPSEPEKPSRNWKREWRELKAEAVGKDKIGKSAEALNMVEKFKLECIMGKAPVDMISEVIKLLDEIGKRQPSRSPKVKTAVQQPKMHTAQNPGAPRTPSVQSNPFKGAKGGMQPPPIPTGRTRGPKSSASTLTPPPLPPKTESVADEGEKLIKENKLKEAREWYKGKGNDAKASKISAVIRQSKSVEQRKKTVDEYRKSRNLVQAVRIVNELKDYLSLCKEIGYEPEDIKALLKEYQKIK